MYRNYQKYSRLPTVRELRELSTLNSSKGLTTNGLYSSTPATTTKTEVVDHEMDDLDAELYGDEPDQPMETDIPEPSPTSATAEEPEKEYHYMYWCLVYGEDGSLQIFSLPDFTERFFVPNFDYLPSLVYDCPDTAGLVEKKRTPYDLNEILMINLGPADDRQDAYLIVSLLSGVDHADD